MSNQNKDQYATPQKLFDKLNREFEFSFDICAQPETAKCYPFLTENDDALSKLWYSLVVPNDYIWCNPPYSNITPWIEKAAEAQVNGVGVVMLVMCDPSVGWFKRAIETVSEVRFIIGGRVSFVKDGEPQKGNNKGSVIFVFNPHNIGDVKTRYIDRSEFE